MYRFRFFSLFIASVLLASIPASLHADATHATDDVGGHTTFSMVPARADAAATRVPLVGGSTTGAMPGVAWFNDQYLLSPSPWPEAADAPPVAAVALLVVDPDGDTPTHPCGGAVLAVNAGDPNPTRLAAALHLGTGSGLTYSASYLFVDPNDRAWIVDAYTAHVAVDEAARVNVDVGRDGVRMQPYPVWVVNLPGPHGSVSTFTPHVPGHACAPFLDRPLAFTEPTDPVLHGGMSFCYAGPAAPWGGDCDEDVPDRTYNAVLAFPLGPDHVRPTGEREHGPWSYDTNGCDSPGWPCFDDDFHMQGNSHPFHPFADPADTGRYAEHHPVGEVDVYWSPETRPPEPDERVFTYASYAGSDAPFHEHG